MAGIGYKPYIALMHQTSGIAWLGQGQWDRATEALLKAAEIRQEQKATAVDESFVLGRRFTPGFGAWGGLFGGGAFGGAGGYTNTPEGKVLASAFADAYNNLVKSVKNYKAQEVRGGLGKGGRLGVGK